MKFEDVSKRVDAYRLRVNVSKAEMARAMSLSPSVLNNIVTGYRPPTTDFLNQFIATYPDVSLEWLFRGTGPMLLSETKVAKYQSDNDNALNNESEVIINFQKMLSEKDRRIEALTDRLLANAK